MIIPSAGYMRLTRADTAVIWEIVHELDYLQHIRKIPKDISQIDDAMWLSFEAKRLRNPDGRDDNFHTKKVLKKLQGLVMEGEYQGDEWGAVFVAEFRTKHGGSVIEILVPPTAIKTVLAPTTFAKIENEAKYRMKGASALLYTDLSNKKNYNKKTYYEYELEELRDVCQVIGKYPEWYELRRNVVQPAINEINKFGTVRLKMTTIKEGRVIVKIRIDWEWKSVDEALDTSKANDNHSSARGKTSDGSAPPLTDEQMAKQAAFDAWKLDNPEGEYTDFLDWKNDQAKALNG